MARRSDLNEIRKQGRKSIVIPSSSKLNLPEKIDQDNLARSGVEETEVEAQVMLSVDSGWAWVVLVCATLTCGILEGIVFSFGPLLPEITKEFKVSVSVASLVSSVEVALFFLASPVASALVNRYGFRTMGMTGSIITSWALFFAYFSKNFHSLLLTYGALNGIGLSIANVAGSVVVGFYFEKYRTLAITTVSAGTSIGVMILYPVNVKVIQMSSWRTLVIFQAGLTGIIYFLALSFRPLVSFQLKVEQDGQPTQTITYLPSTVDTVGTDKSTEGAAVKATKPERLLRAVSNINYPTAAEIIQGSTIDENDNKAPKEARKSIPPKLTLRSSISVSPGQLKTIQSHVSSRKLSDRQPKTSATAKTGQDIAGPSAPQTFVVEAEVETREKTSCWARLCNWRSNSPENRPMYRDDVFYTGNIKKLPEYRRSVLATPKEERTGLEYQLAVTRAAATEDLREEHHGVCTQALRRVLASMLDPTLLKKLSFIYFLSTGLFIWSGVMVPYVFMEARAVQFGLDPTLASLLISALSVTGIFAKILGSVLSAKFGAVNVYGASILIAGVSTAFSGLSYSVTYQFGYAILFGMTYSPSACLRSVILVESYGLQNLTNATGLMLLVVGVANIYGTPLGAVIKENFGYDAAFYYSGACMAMAGIMSLIPLNIQLRREKRQNSS